MGSQATQQDVLSLFLWLTQPPMSGRASLHFIITLRRHLDRLQISLALVGQQLTELSGTLMKLGQLLQKEKKVAIENQKLP